MSDNATPVLAPVLAVEGLEVRYGEARAVFGIDLEVAVGQVVAVLGPNGAGKTSLAAAITGRVTPAAGQVRIAGHDVAGRSASQISRLGVAYVPEERAIFPHLSVIDNLRVLLRYAVPRAERATAVDRALVLFPVLAERRRQQAGTLSGGEQQMLALARALMLAPRILLVDEPSVGLAPLLVARTIDAIKQLKDHYKLTVLMAEQNFTQAIRIADRGYVIVHGKIAFEGRSADELNNNDLIRQFYLGM
jgi:branched-chain amino acid transport system ATP-binding protein